MDEIKPLIYNTFLQTYLAYTFLKKKHDIMNITPYRIHIFEDVIVEFFFTLHFHAHTQTMPRFGVSFIWFVLI
jgi:hypothetical protein